MTTTVDASPCSVSHDGARWLPGGPRRAARPDPAAATASSPSTPAARTTAPTCSRDALGDDAVLAAPGVDVVPRRRRASGSSSSPPPADDEWVWLLHDDAQPRPRRARSSCWPRPPTHPDGRRARPQAARVALAAPAARGRRHDLRHRPPRDRPGARRVRPGPARRASATCWRSTPPACWSAARVLEELGGFDDAAADLRQRHRLRLARRAGRPPDRRGARRRWSSTPRPPTAASAARRSPGGTPHYQERRAALYTLLANARAPALPLQVVRLAARHAAAGRSASCWCASVGRGARRARRPGRRSTAAPARSSPRRRDAAEPPPATRADVRPPAGALVAALPARPRLRQRPRSALAPGRRRPPPAGAGRSRRDRPGRRGRRRTCPRTPACWPACSPTRCPRCSLAGRAGPGRGPRAWSARGPLTGGALLPAPGSALRLVAHLHLGAGTTSAPARRRPRRAVRPAARGRSAPCCSARPGCVVDVLFLLAVPLAALGAYRFLLRLTSSLPMSLWGAVAYGVLPVVTGAVQQGRLGTVAGTLVLPWLAHAALFLGPRRTTPDRRRRPPGAPRCGSRCWPRSCPSPGCSRWCVAVVALAADVRRPRGPAGRPPRRHPAGRHTGAAAARGRWRPGPTRAPRPGCSRPACRCRGSTGVPGAGTPSLGRPGDGAPAWMAVGVLLAALVALARPDTRPGCSAPGLVLVAALLVTAALAVGSYATGRPSRPTQPLWLGFPLVVAQAAAITAAAARRHRHPAAARRVRTSAGGSRSACSSCVLAALTPGRVRRVVGLDRAAAAPSTAAAPPTSRRT